MWAAHSTADTVSIRPLPWFPGCHRRSRISFPQRAGSIVLLLLLAWLAAPQAAPPLREPGLSLRQLPHGKSFSRELRLGARAAPTAGAPATIAARSSSP